MTIRAPNRPGRVLPRPLAFSILVLSLLCLLASNASIVGTNTNSIPDIQLSHQFDEDENSNNNTFSNKTESSPYVIIIDGGSTGSRLHIFEFIDDAVVRHGFKRADEPLSAYGPTLDNPVVDPQTVAAHLMPAFIFAAQQVPKRYHATTSVQYQATAGMRLLAEWQQHAVYDALFEGLLSHPDFVFKSLQRSDIQTLSGELEGYYGAVAANYLHGTCNADLSLKDSDDHPIGALDMGGSSTQIVFLPKQNESNASKPSNEEMIAHDNKSPSPVQVCSFVDTYGDLETQTCQTSLDEKKYGLAPVRTLLNDDNKFFSTSYLSYGVDQFRERLWTTWVVEHKRQYQQQSEHDSSCDAKLIENPCAFQGYTMEWHGYSMIGTGNTTACINEVKRLIPHPEVPMDHGSEYQNTVAGIVNPPVHGHRFVAMSLFFFSLDSLRELSGSDKLNENWPNPSIQELVDALPGLCSRSWNDDLYKIQHNAHKYTRAEVLPHRCLESVYMVTLLRDGFGFAPESRSITFLYETEDGNEVEWTLGMALAVNALSTRSNQQKGSTSEEQQRQETDKVSTNNNMQSETSPINDTKSEKGDRDESEVSTRFETSEGSDNSYQFLFESFKGGR